MRTVDGDSLMLSLIGLLEEAMRIGDFSDAATISRIKILIKNAPTVNEWISVKERLPEEGGEYLVGWYGSDDVVLARFTRDCFGMNFSLLDPEKEHRPAFYYEDDEWGTCELKDIECWMQKPVPPKERESAAADEEGE